MGRCRKKGLKGIGTLLEEVNTATLKRLGWVTCVWSLTGLRRSGGSISCCYFSYTIFFKTMEQKKKEYFHYTVIIRGQNIITLKEFKMFSF